jgi:hypothetical protein
MLRATNYPILRSNFDCIYNFWYNVPTLLSTVDTVKKVAYIVVLVMHIHTNIKYSSIYDVLTTHVTNLHARSVLRVQMQLNYVNTRNV